MITCIVPVYNTKVYLNRCIDSLLVQSRKDYEILIIDDGSTDGSGQICDFYDAKYQNIRVIHTENKGLSCARNLGIEEARGEYICFIDSDDFIQPDYLEVLYSLCSEYNADIAGCQYTSLSKDENCIYPDIQNVKPHQLGNEKDKQGSHCVYVYNSDEICELMYSKDFVRYVVVWNKLYKKSIFDEIRFTVGIHHEDEDIIHKLYYYANKTVYTSRSLYFYCYNSNSIMHNASQRKRNYTDCIDAFYNRFRFFRDKNEPKQAYMAFNLFFTQVVSFLTIICKEKNRNEYKEIKNKYYLKYKQGRNQIDIPRKRYLYYELFFQFDKLIICTRDFVHRLRKE